MKKVITIEPSTPAYQRVETTSQFRRRRVAGYARVSTDHDDQTTSYEAQMKYYTDYITGRADWEFVGMYSDEGISGTSTKHRTGFRQMVDAALSGQIDLIITKSVSRFARNTVDSLSTVRRLKDAGVEIYFEKENIWTFDSKGELLITIMSSLAQEESRSISENVTWSLRKKFAQGRVSFPYTNVLGFDKNEQGEIIVKEDEAKVVRYIFQQALLGKSPYAIANDLTRQGVKTPKGRKQWSAVTIKRMLQNEKYKGDALLQKTYTTDFLTKNKKVNEGELPQYYVENNHEAIIDRETFDLVQKMMDKGRKSSTSIFASKLVCGECGGFYGSKVWHSNSKYRRVIYRCNKKYDDGKTCQTPHVTEEEIKTAFVEEVNKLLDIKEEVIDNLNHLLEMISDTTTQEQAVEQLQDRLQSTSEQINRLITLNASTAMNQEQYRKEYDVLLGQYEQTEIELHHQQKKLVEVKDRCFGIKSIINCLSEQGDLLTEFDEMLWLSMVDIVNITETSSLSINFKIAEV